MPRQIEFSWKQGENLTLILDGEDVSHLVRGFKLEVAPPHYEPRLLLDLMPSARVVEGE